MFRHHPDDLIYLDHLALPLAFWLEQEPAYSLPDEAIGREYVPEQRHTVYGTNGILPEFCVLPWAEGDRYLSQIEAYRATWEAVNISPPTSPAPQWDVFRTAMMTDVDYRSMLIKVMSPVTGGVGNWLGTTMQQAIAMPSPAIPLIRPLWNQIVNFAPPPPEAVERWQGYAQQSHVPLFFAVDGSLGEMR